MYPIPSLLATLETVFFCYQIYDMFITRLGKTSLLDEIVLYVFNYQPPQWVLIECDCVSAL